MMGAVIIAALNEAGIHTNSLTAVFAAAGLAISLALKDSLSNLASGVMILLFRPYNINDNVEAAGMSGAVEEVQIFSTIFRTRRQRACDRAQFRGHQEQHPQPFGLRDPPH